MKIREASSRTAANLVLLPQLPKTVILQPRFQTLGVKARKGHFTVCPVSHNHVFRLKMIQQEGRLRGHNHLRLQRSLFDQGGQHSDGIWVQAEFGLIQKDDGGPSFPRLLQQGGQGDEAQGTVRECRGVEIGVRIPVPPLKPDFVFVQRQWY